MIKVDSERLNGLRVVSRTYVRDELVACDLYDQSTGQLWVMTLVYKAKAPVNGGGKEGQK